MSLNKTFLSFLLVEHKSKQQLNKKVITASVCFQIKYSERKAHICFVTLDQKGFNIQNSFIEQDNVMAKFTLVDINDFMLFHHRNLH